MKRILFAALLLTPCAVFAATDDRGTQTAKINTVSNITTFPVSNYTVSLFVLGVEPVKDIARTGPAADCNTAVVVHVTDNSVADYFGIQVLHSLDQFKAYYSALLSSGLLNKRLQMNFVEEFGAVCSITTFNVVTN